MYAERQASGPLSRPAPLKWANQHPGLLDKDNPVCILLDYNHSATATGVGG